MTRIASLLWLAALVLACSDSGTPGTDAAVSAEEAAKAPAGEEIVQPSGLRITHLTVGSDERPNAGDVVKVHYHGTFEDGSVFDSSVERGQPAAFPLSRVIPCWTEGVQLIGVGGKARLVCPPEIAYGAAGAPPRIPANATLNFEVELLEIVKR
ncbi:MAG: FKBP-type peptidyl-prolyl cis-trans isomerase [Myxococcota bacterium]|nr:FKBP-type peptidyl-prolyl cis-trans isomerase [Myxococcota bacterium]